jgi:hypothetical protein
MNPVRKTPREVRFDTWSPPLQFRENVTWLARLASAFLKHYFRRLDYGRNRVADLEIHFLGASPGDYALDRILAHADGYVRHHAIDLKLNYFPFDLVSC